MKGLVLAAAIASGGCNARGVPIDAPDLRGILPQDDLAAPVDLSFNEDFSSVADLAVPIDLSSPLDLAYVGDLAQLPKRVFVTSRTFVGGKLGGLVGADASCQSLATAAGLTGTYQAWLSDNSYSPSTRMTHSSGPYVLVNGSVIAVNWNDLTKGNLRHAIDLDENGAAPLAVPTSCGYYSVWTDTDTRGMLNLGGDTCGEWTDVQGSESSWGSCVDQTNWTSFCNGGQAAVCGTAAFLYCFEQ